MKEYIKRGIPINEVHDIYDRNALHYACHFGYIDMVKYLIETYHMKIDTPDVDGCYPLHIACMKGHIDIVIYFVLDCHMDIINSIDKKGSNALHYAIMNGHLNIVKYLIDICDCNCRIQNKDGYNALHCACVYGHMDIVQYLIDECHMIVTTQNKYGMNALHYASKCGHIEIVKYLINTCNCDGNVESQDGMNALHYASEYGHLITVQYLIKKCNMNVASTTKTGKTAYDLAKQYDKYDVAEYLLSVINNNNNIQNDHYHNDHHDNINKHQGNNSKSKENRIHHHQSTSSSQSNRHHQITNTNINANTEHIDTNQTTPKQNDTAPTSLPPPTIPITNLTSAQVTTYCNMSTSDQNQLQNVFFTSAIDGNMTNLIRCIQKYEIPIGLQNDYGYNALHYASWNGHIDMVKYLIVECQFDMNSIDKKGSNALHCASRHGHLDIVTYLISECKINCTTQDYEGWNALHYACMNGHLDIAQYLINECKIDDIHIQTNFGWNALHIACGNGYINVVRYLIIQCNMKIDTPDFDGCNSLHIACYNGRIDIVKYFINECHVNVWTPTKYGGETSYDLAIQYDKKDVAEYLLTVMNNNNDQKKDIHKHPKQTSTTSQTSTAATNKAALSRKKGNIKPDPPTTIRMNQHISTKVEEFFHSAINGDLNTLIECIEQGNIDVEMKDTTGRTVLHYASAEGHIEIVKYLVGECHVDATVTTKQGETSYYLAKVNHKYVVVDYLLSMSNNTRNDVTNTSHTTVTDSMNTSVSTLSFKQEQDEIRYLEPNGEEPNYTNEDSTETINDDYHMISPASSTKQIIATDPTSILDRISIIDERLLLLLENSVLNESYINELRHCYEINNQCVLDVLDRLNSTNQFTSESYTVLQQMIVEKCYNQQDINEQKAILESSIHRDFYILLNRKLYCMINACENLTSGMIASNGNGNSFRSYVTDIILRDRSIDVLKTTKIGLLVGSAINWTKKNIAIVPFTDTIGSILHLIVTLNAERDRYLSIARVADFATMACLNRNSDGSTTNLRNVVEKCSRLIVRARHGRLPSCEYIQEENDQFCRIKQYVLFLLAESGDTVAKEQACKAADCAFAHIMKPNKESILYDVLNGDDTDTSLEEALAATILGISVDTLRSLDPFTTASSSPTSAATATAATTTTITTSCTSVSGVDVTSCTFENNCTIQECIVDNLNVVKDVHDSELQENLMSYDATIIEQHNKEIDKLKETIHQIKNEMGKSKPIPNYDAGNGFVYMNPNDQTDSDKELAAYAFDKELASTDLRVRQLELLFDTLVERLSSLEQKTETMVIGKEMKRK